MALEDTLIWVNLAVLVLGFVGSWIYLGRRFGSLEENLHQGLQSIAAYMESHGRLLGALSETEVISSQALHQIKEPLLRATIDPINRLLSRISPGNPITMDEVQQLRNYTERVQRGETLTRQEAEDFYRLSKRLAEEDRYRHDIGTFFLIGLAAFVLGLVLGSKRNGKS
jgi:hypothetical protein